MSARSRRAPWFRPDPSTRYAIETGGEYGLYRFAEETTYRAVEQRQRAAMGLFRSPAEVREREDASGPIHVRFTSTGQGFGLRMRVVDGAMVTEQRIDDGEWAPYVEPPDDSAGDTPGTGPSPAAPANDR